MASCDPWLLLSYREAQVAEARAKSAWDVLSDRMPSASWLALKAQVDADIDQSIGSSSLLAGPAERLQRASMLLKAAEALALDATAIHAPLLPSARTL